MRAHLSLFLWVSLPFCPSWNVCVAGSGHHGLVFLPVGEIVDFVPRSSIYVTVPPPSWSRFCCSLCCNHLNVTWAISNSSGQLSSLWKSQTQFTSSVEEVCFKTDVFIVRSSRRCNAAHASVGREWKWALFLQSVPPWLVGVLEIS